MERRTIGIDLGHGQCAAALPFQPTADSRYIIQQLELFQKEKVIPTQLILTNKQMKLLSGNSRPSYDLLCQLGEIQIGDKAVGSDEQKFIYFKVAPKYFSKVFDDEPAKGYGISYGALMACFAFALLHNLFKYNRDDLSGVEHSNIDLLIGCPTTSDWTNEKALNDYAELIQKATRVHSVRIIPESRAAMFSSVENQWARISAVNGAMVFDFGSSTADCTYMLLGRKIIEFSCTLGASKIEEQMRRNAYREACRAKGPFTPTTASIVKCDNEFRKVKEAYYNGTYGFDEHETIAPFINADDGKRVSQIVSIDKDYMDKITNQTNIGIKFDSKEDKYGSWGALCRDFFQEAKRRVESASYAVIENDYEKMKACPVADIVLTGGASQMNFVEELCREVFPDAKIYKETNPSYTVSNGLAWVAVTDENSAACKEAARKKVDANGGCKISTLKSDISEALFKKIVSIVETRTLAWADRPEEELSVRVLQDDLASYINGPAGQTELKNVCQQHIISWKSKLSTVVEQAINEQIAQLYSEQVARSLIIPDDVWQELQTGVLSTNQIDVGKALGDLDLSGVMLKIGKFVVNCVIWAVAWALAPETLFLSVIAAFLVTTITDFAMTDTDLDKGRKRSTRIKAAKKIRDAMEKKKEEILDKFNNSLDEQTQSFSDIVDETLSVAFEIVTLKRFDL